MSVSTIDQIRHAAHVPRFGAANGRRLFCAILAVSVATGQAEGGERVVLTVSAASSLADAFEAIAKRFEQEHTTIDVQFNFGGSNHLQRQIEAGAAVDVFASAGGAPMDALVRRGSADGSTARVFASNRLVLIVAKGNPAGIGSFDDLGGALIRRVAIGAEGVPVGRYAAQVLERLGLSDGMREKLVYGIHARQVLEYVARGEADAGLAYASDARAAADRIEIVAYAERRWHDEIRYPAAVIAASDHRTEALAFVEYCTSPGAQAILSAYGFIPVARVDGGSGAVREEGGADSADAWSEALSAMKLSLVAAGGALLIVFPLGTVLGAVLAKRAFVGRELLDAVLTLPMVLPPTVTGYVLIILLGGQSTAGRMLEVGAGIRVSLTIVGAAVASGVVAFPLMFKSARAAFESVDPELESASYALGKGRATTFLRISIPLARGGLAAGAILSFARAIGEFGATFMIAGIIPGRTMTMPSAIFHAFTNHRDRTAQVLVVVLTVFSVLVIWATNRLNGRATRPRG